MTNRTTRQLISTLSILFTITLLGISSAWAVPMREGWEKRPVNWRAGGDRRIKAIRGPHQSATQTQPKMVKSRELAQKSTEPSIMSMSSLAPQTVQTNTIQVDSPPVGGFVPYIAMAVTDQWAGDDTDWVAATEFSVRGRFLTDSPETNFTIGLFDTGASTHIVSYAGAQRTGIYTADLLTPSMVELSGATNSAFGWVSYPLAVFMDGLGAIDPNSEKLSHAHMVGQSNVSIVIGDEPLENQPDLPTVMGSPMSIYLATSINNDDSRSIIYDGNEYTGPNLRFYGLDDPEAPRYTNSIPLNVLPSGAINVQYIIDYDAIFELVFRPGTPSIIIGNSSQSLFFVNSVDLHEGERSAIDKTRFMLDTGAQVTVVGSGVASRLGLNPTEPDFEVEIQDVTGTITIHPGFLVDTLEIPSLGDWLTFSQVPIVMLDIASPEGGYLEGIIGMNLFTEFNLLLRGGGMLGQDPPSLEFEQRTWQPLTGDIAPGVGDDVVDSLDLASLCATWLLPNTATRWNPRADLYPPQIPDEQVHLADFAIMGNHWQETTAKPTSPSE